MFDMLDLGALAIVFAISNKALEFGIAVVKARLNGGADKESTDPAREALIQSSINGDLLEDVKQDVKKVYAVVIEGNGKEGLVTQIAVLSKTVDTHIKDQSIHKGKQNE